jgi:lipoyl synthase
VVLSLKFMPPTPKEVWEMPNHELLALLKSGKLQPISGTIRFYAPSFTYYRTKHFCSNATDFPTISVTGNACALECAHCGGKVLQTMHAAVSPETLYGLGVKLKEKGARGVLVSGGCLPDGSVPLDAFVPTLARLKREIGLTVFVHTGIIGEKTAFALKKAGVDAALIDIIGSAETIAKVYNLNVSVQDYVDSLAALQKSGLSFVPHVIVGLNGGTLNGEYAALRLISAVQPTAVVVIAFMPIRDTKMAHTPPSQPLDIVRVAASARVMFPTVPLLLGCMRPKGKARSQGDVYALQAGVDGVAFPSLEALEYAEKRFAVTYSSYCCAQLGLDFRQ